MPAAPPICYSRFRMDPAARERALALLEHFVSTPTAPFHEERVIAKVRTFARERGHAVREDAHGNLLVSRKGRSDAPPWIVTGHMDHPGFEILEAGAKRAVARWTGGVRAEYFQGAPVIVYGRDREVCGRVSGTRVDPATQRVKEMTLLLQGDVAPGDFGSWDLVPHEREGGVISSKSIDDLAGCAVAAAVLDALDTEEADAPVGALFTRGEEAGFIGAWGATRSGLLPPEARIVNVEASSAIPGVAAGAGPVVRVGDRMTTFDPATTLALSQAGEALAREDPAFRFQRFLMTGGACEATAFTLAGYATGAVALPLVNYHNMGPAGRIEPERIHVEDFLGAVRLLTRFLARPADAPGFEALRERLEESFEKQKDRLRSRAP